MAISLDQPSGLSIDR